MPVPSASEALPATGHESSSLFKNFWSKTTLKKPLRFISYSSENADSGGTKQNTSENLSRRRKQTYEAKQRHEARKADYVKSLEQEINKLRKDTAAVRKETLRLATETRFLKDVAHAHGLDTTEASAASSAKSLLVNDITIEIGFDDAIQAERAFIKPSNVSGLVPEQAIYPKVVSSAQQEPTAPQEDPVVYAVLDFILALEHVCRAHIHYPWSTSAHEFPEANGHIFTTTASLFSNCIPEPRTISESNTLAALSSETTTTSTVDYRISYAEIQKLLLLSDALPVPEGEVTPVQAVRIIEARVPRNRLIAVLERLKSSLGPAMRCFGYGASMEIEALDRALASLADF